jgi:hypothetical protein
MHQRDDLDRDLLMRLAAQAAETERELEEETPNASDLTPPT